MRVLSTVDKVGIPSDFNILEFSVKDLERSAPPPHPRWGEWALVESADVEFLEQTDP